MLGVVQGFEIECDSYCVELMKLVLQKELFTVEQTKETVNHRYLQMQLKEHVEPFELQADLFAVFDRHLKELAEQEKAYFKLLKVFEEKSTYKKDPSCTCVDYLRD